MANSSESPDEDIHDEIITDVAFPDEDGTVHALRRIVQGDRRVDWKMGHIDGTFAEASDYYYDGEMFEQNPIVTIPENGPSGRYTDEKFYETLDVEPDFEDGDVTIIHDEEGADAVERAVVQLEGSMGAETILDEWWTAAWSRQEDDE